MQMPMTADATRPPKSFTTDLCPSLAGDPLEALKGALSLQRGIARLAWSPASHALSGSPLSFADSQIWNWLTAANPPIGEPCGRRDGIWNSFKLFSYSAFREHLRLTLPPLSTGSPPV
jgi:hypothetical protein